MKKPANSRNAKSKKKAGGDKGCCTLTGSGPAEVYEGLTKEECRLLAIKKGKNDHWWAGKCAKPISKT